MYLMEFANVHVAVDNDVFAKLLRFAQLILLFGIVMSIVDVLCKCTLLMFFATFAGNHFLKVGCMSNIRRVQKSKAPIATRRRRRKWSYWQPDVETWQRPCFREVFHMDIQVCCVLIRKYLVQKICTCLTYFANIAKI